MARSGRSSSSSIRVLSSFISWGLLAKLLGVGREVLLARLLGAGPEVNGFRVAQTGTFVPINLMTSDLLSAAFLPRYTQLYAQDRERAARMLVSYIVGILLLTCGIAIASSIFADSVVGVVAPGLGTTGSEFAGRFLRVLAWSGPLIALSSLLNYSLAARGSFRLVSVRPLIQSVGLILGTVVAALTGDVVWLGLGFLSAWFAFCGLSVWAALAGGQLTWCRRPALAYWWREAGQRLRPLLLLPILLQSAIVLERILSSLLSGTAIASVDYARVVGDSFVQLVAVPLGLMGLAKIPLMSKERRRELSDRLLDVLIIIGMPISLAVVATAPALSAVLYGSQALSDHVIAEISLVLSGLSVGLWCQVGGYALTRFLMAAGRNREVFAITGAALGAQVGVQSLSVAGVGPFALGLGPSIYGLVLMVGCYSRLGLSKRGCVNFAIGILVFIVGVITVVGLQDSWVAAACAVCAFSIILIATLRTSLREVITLARSARGGGPDTEK